VVYINVTFTAYFMWFVVFVFCHYMYRRYEPGNTRLWAASGRQTLASAFWQSRAVNGERNLPFVAWWDRD